MDEHITLRCWTEGELRSALVGLANQRETVAQLLRRLKEDVAFRDLKTLFDGERFIGLVVINQQIVDPSKLETLTLKRGDLVKVLRPVSGGL